MTEENHNLFNVDFDILNEDFDFDEGKVLNNYYEMFLGSWTDSSLADSSLEYSDDEAIQLVDQLNEKAGISNAFLSEISDCM